MSDPLPAMTPMTALGGTTPRVDTHGPVTLTEITNLALASVTARLGQEGACAAQLQDALGQAAPGVEMSVMEGTVEAFWTGPNQWMLSAPHETHETLSVQLKTQLGVSASVTEQNDGWAVFDLEGDVTPVMELLSPINMRRFEIGHARRTPIDHLGCFVTRRSNTLLRILGPRSAAGSLYHAICTAVHSAH